MAWRLSLSRWKLLALLHENDDTDYAAAYFL